MSRLVRPLGSGSRHQRFVAREQSEEEAATSPGSRKGRIKTPEMREIRSRLCCNADPNLSERKRVRKLVPYSGGSVPREGLVATT